MRPTIFANVTNDMTIAREEIFGPVLAILPYKTEEEAIAMANDTVYGLSGYVQSGDIDHARKVAGRLRTGNVHLNGAGPTSPRPSAASNSRAMAASGASSASRNSSRSRPCWAGRPPDRHLIHAFQGTPAGFGGRFSLSPGRHKSELPPRII
ncbi:aldehyde dehydrogenase family protein [Oleomonas cavernae]